MDTQIKRHRQIKPFHLNTVFAKNVVTPINKLTVAQLNSYLSKQPSFNLIRNEPDYLKMHFLNTKITLKCLFFFSANFFCRFFVGGVTTGVTSLAGSPLLASAATGVVSSLADRICG